MLNIYVPVKRVFPFLAILLLSGCAAQNGAGTTSSTSGTDTYKEQTTTTVSVDRATGAESRNTTTQIITPGDEHRAQVNIDTTRGADTVINVDADGDNFRAETESGYADPGSTTHIRAPLFKMDKNRESGSVHIKLPFIHIDKDPGGSARVDIGRHH
ncbi:MAG: hypothetical protein QG574_2512 [Cyanobacteriota bacterium erpe_2018_sw_21hr_WHONDRS-SW48-000092_B_bin.40]|jgi:hypothetical protein|nr:hypothetical protein [Cyanobacteriota bacterium erpe_2018_sw_21hr_WHONDRS-SW48-000092_B_bin.40]